MVLRFAVYWSSTDFKFFTECGPVKISYGLRLRINFHFALLRWLRRRAKLAKGSYHTSHQSGKTTSPMLPAISPYTLATRSVYETVRRA